MTSKDFYSLYLRPSFFEPLFTMPTPRFTPQLATTHSGRNVDFAILSYALQDLFDFGYLHLQEYAVSMDWLRSYQEGGALPGDRRFYCPWSGEMVYFLQFLDGLFELYVMAKNSEDLTDTENEDPNPEDDDFDDIDIWFPWPINIGRYGLGPTFRWLH